MEDKRLIKPKVHNIVLEGREKLNISGVVDVSSFDEHAIVLETEMGGLVIKGSGLHINRLNVDEGNLLIEGYVASCTYNDKTDNKKTGSFFSSLFK